MATNQATNLTSIFKQVENSIEITIHVCISF